MKTRKYLLVATLFAASFLPPSPGFAQAIYPGFDLLALQPGSQWDFGVDTPIPADFFFPGSDPFLGLVPLMGEPTGPGNTDTIVERLEGIDPFPQGPAIQPIDIEIVELSLVSVAPITVTRNGGSDPELWDVKIMLAPVPQLTGVMQINHQFPIGGTFQVQLPITPQFVFTPLDFTSGKMTFEGSPVDFSGTEAAWLEGTPSPHDAHTLTFPAGDLYAPQLSPAPWYGIQPTSGSSSTRLFYGAAVPEPAGPWLLVVGLIGLVVARWHRGRTVEC